WPGEAIVDQPIPDRVGLADAHRDSARDQELHGRPVRRDVNAAGDHVEAFALGPQAEVARAPGKLAGCAPQPLSTNRSPRASPPARQRRGSSRGTGSRTFSSKISYRIVRFSARWRAFQSSMSPPSDASVPFNTIPMR